MTLLRFAGVPAQILTLELVVTTGVGKILIDLVAVEAGHHVPGFGTV
jgi:hypothetical protein